MSNQFKSNYTTKKNNTKLNDKNVNNYNSFISENKSKIPIKFNPLKSDFPELSVTHKSVEAPRTKEFEIDAKNTDINHINFIDIVKKETKLDEENKNNIPQGWVSYSLGKHNKVEIEYGSNTEPLPNINETEEEEEFPPSEIMNNAINIIVNNMERHKIDFIERNGEDEYYRIYNYQNTDPDIEDIEVDEYLSDDEYDDYY